MDYRAFTSFRASRWQSDALEANGGPNRQSAITGKLQCSMMWRRAGGRSPLYGTAKGKQATLPHMGDKNELRTPQEDPLDPRNAGMCTYKCILPTLLVGGIGA